ncbi:prion-like protein doppel [Elgaria multicarinata webbii]|uniref:prion-like protein doppel n=1 Tax=Elgaria multicarinata webbii TaxID=159646 RepID=UPI002FCCE664
MQKNLAAAILLVVLCGDVCLCWRPSGSGSRRNRKSSTSSTTKQPTTTPASTIQKNLCYGGQMIDNMELELNDTKFYKDNWKAFPDGLYYPNCFSPRRPNMTQEALIGECVNFTMTSSKLKLPKKKESSNPKDRVMWVVINHLCANESCGQPCSRPSNAGGCHYIDRLLMIVLVGCSVLLGQIKLQGQVPDMKT